MMGRIDDDGCLTYLGFVGFIFLSVFIFPIIFSERALIYTLPSIVIIALLWYFVSKYKANADATEKAKENLKRQYQEKERINLYLNDTKIKLKEKTDLSEKLLRQNMELKEVLNSKTPFNIISSLYADAEMSIFHKEEFEMRNKKPPAKVSADKVKELRNKSRNYIEQYKEMLYKYEFLLKTFPELEKYVDDYEALKNISKCTSYSEVEENTDRASEYLSKDEWIKMPVDERNQLALDRYKEREKSNWVIGIEYEMYIDYLLREKGFSTIHCGVNDGLNDLGRDIIAKKNGKYYVIQCKNWSRRREIHENVVCQLFGTAIEYKIEREEYMPLFRWDEKVFPVLYTTTELSKTAMKFADKLGVQIIIKEKGEYPMIKCNIGRNGEKIYHLPFDQQYYKVLIEEEKGEFYAWTVKEAVGKGFRRAYKYSGYSNPSI